MTRSIGFAEGFLGMRAAIARSNNEPLRHLDWMKAAEIIKAERPVAVEAGLDGDFDCTSSFIYRDGAPVAEDGSSYYGTSNWGIPTLVLHYDDGKQKEVECWSEGEQDPRLWWPANALAAVNGDSTPRDVPA